MSDLVDIKYKTIYLDPPWNETGGGKIKRGADRHYPLMKTDEIIQLLCTELSGKINQDAHLYLWVTNNFIPDGLRVIKALGFDYKTMITWFKVDETGRGNIGLGQYFRGITEHCLFAVKGVLPYKVIDEKRQQGRTGFYAPKREHSQKPDEMYKIIETVSYPPYLEMFARFERAGWDTFGNEVGKLNKEVSLFDDSFLGSITNSQGQPNGDAEADNQSTRGEAETVADLNVFDF